MISRHWQLDTWQEISAVKSLTIQNMSPEGLNNPGGKEIFNYLFNVKQKVLVFHLDEFRDNSKIDTIFEFT